MAEEVNFTVMEVKGEAIYENDSIEPIIHFNNCEVIQNMPDPLDFLKIENLPEAENQEECITKEPDVVDGLQQRKCNICHEQFSSNENIHTHSSIHNNMNHIFMCSHCSECFVTRTSLNTHQLTHSASYTVACGIGEKSLPCVRSIRNKRIHRLVACVLCYKRFADSKELDKHILDEHNSKDKSSECDICHKIITSPAGLKTHKRTHQFTVNKEVKKEHIEKIYECDVCRVKLSSQSTFKSHKFLHLTQKCDKCHKCFSTKSKLDKRKLDEQNLFLKCDEVSLGSIKTLKSTVDLVECDKCQELFTDTKELYQHRTSEDVEIIDDEILPRKPITTSIFKPHKGNAPSEELYSCDVCGESFENNVALNTHKFTHIGGKISFACNKCDQKFDSSERRNKHELVHGNKKIEKKINDTTNPFKCPICHTQFANKINLNYHTKTHHFLKNVQNYTRKKNRNMKSVNKEGKGYVCRICHVRCSNRVRLIQHKKIHKNADVGEVGKRNSNDCTKSHECTLCHKRFYHKKNLILHTKSHVNVNKTKQSERQINRQSRDPGLQCKLCFKKIGTAEKFKIHTLNHLHGCPYRCTLCHKRFAHKSKLSFHLRTRHVDSVVDNNHQIVCNFCNEEYTSLSELTLHKQSQHSLECDICHKRFTTKYVLRDHIRIHTGEMPYKCEECHRQFRTLMNLNGHMIVHKQEKRHECTICHEWFTRTSNLKYHLNKRHFFKDYGCDICHEQFTNEYNRDQHVKTQHSEDAIFECDRCFKRFKNKYALKEHERIHTGEKPYECKICLKRFRTGPNLNSHVGSVHKQDRNHECSVCHKRFSRGSNLNRHMKTHME